MSKIISTIAIIALLFLPCISYAQGPDKGRILEKAVFIHHKDNFAKPINPNVKRTPACYGFLSKGAKLKSTQSLVIQPNINGQTIMTSANTWDTQTSSSLISDYTTDQNANWDGSLPDGRNELSFGNYDEAGVIAITVAWGYFSGAPSTKEIVEFDILFDTDYTWGDASISPEVMDLENIATHEIGHGLGLKDVYEDSCGAVTMYGYSDNGDIAKRTLEPQDITGLRTLYGV